MDMVPGGRSGMGWTCLTNCNDFLFYFLLFYFSSFTILLSSNFFYLLSFHVLPHVVYD